ncbi:MAG: hypothetical protein FJ290_15110 [Planctomycetes bacterium]|nr:hypothetical protein [Planctomycetota bacterium]
MLVGLAVGVGLWLRRRWLEVTDHGFIVTDRQGRREFRDDDVRELRSYCINVYRSGLLDSRVRCLTLWVEQGGRSEALEMACKAGPSEQGLPEVLGARVSAGLYPRVRSAVEAGGSFAGDGWEVEKNGLWVARGPGRALLRFDEIGALGDFDNRLCIWEKGAELPAARVPCTSRNLPVLRAFLAERVAEAGEGEAPGGPPGGLGRVLFERRRGSVYWWLLATLGVVFGAGLIAYQVLLPGAGVLAAGILFGFLALRGRRAVFRCHELGVRDIGYFGDRELRYADMDTFTYSAVRQFVNGAYTGTQLVLHFGPRAEGEKKAINYRATLSGADETLDGLCDHVSGVIGRRLAEEFAAGRAVTWTQALRFLPEGLEYRAQGFLGRKDPVVIPYGQIANYDIQQGEMMLWAEGAEKPAVREKVSAPNFFPGLRLLEAILEPEE